MDSEKNKIKLHLGCGHIKKKGWVNIDILKSVNPDICIDIGSKKLPYKNGSVIEIFSDNLFEHLPPPPLKSNFENALKECYRVLSKDGSMKMILPYSTGYGGYYEYHWVLVRYDIYKDFENDGMDPSLPLFSSIDRDLRFPRWCFFMNWINHSPKLIWIYERTALKYLLPATELILIFKK